MPILHKISYSNAIKSKDCDLISSVYITALTCPQNQSGIPLARIQADFHRIRFAKSRPV